GASPGSTQVILVTRTRYRGVDHHRVFGIAGRDVERMQPLDLPAIFFRPGNQVHCPAVNVDDRGASNSWLRGAAARPACVSGGLRYHDAAPRINEAPLPEGLLRAAVCVER